MKIIGRGEVRASIVAVGFGILLGLSQSALNGECQTGGVVFLRNPSAGLQTNGLSNEYYS
jgi:hypothetical protein